MLKVLLLAILLLLPRAAAAEAALGLSRAAAEDRFGAFSLVQAADGTMWRRDEWLARPAGAPAASEYGYLTVAGDRTAAVWLTYDGQDIVSRVAVILDKTVSFRDLGSVLPALQAAAADPGTNTFLLRAYPRDLLAAVIPRPGGDLLVTFDNAGRRDATRLNTHSFVRGFTVARLTAAERELMTMADNDGARTARDGSWRRIENFLAPGLHFSEQLVARKRTDMLVIHHTKIENMTVASIHDLHLRNGWAGIGYHKVILPDGSVADGRPEYAVGAHAIGANSHSVGISLVGDFDVNLPSPAQMASLLALTAELAGKYGVSAANIVGHRDVYKDTTCPGRIFPWAEFKQALAKKLPAK
jgi:hypothetical protein